MIAHIKNAVFKTNIDEQSNKIQKPTPNKSPRLIAGGSANS